MTGWMSGNRAWKVGLAATRVPDEHNTVCLAVRRVGTWACNNKCTRARCKVQEGQRRAQAQHTGISLSAQTAHLRWTAAAFQGLPRLTGSTSSRQSGLQSATAVLCG